MPRNLAEIVFVIDENIGPTIAEGITDAGGKVLMLMDVVPMSTPDLEWLPRAREWGHAILTRDIGMRRTPAEAAALNECGVHVFILRAHGLLYDALRELVKARYAVMVRHVRNHSTPFIAHVTRDEVRVHVGGQRKSAIKRA